MASASANNNINNSNGKDEGIMKYKGVRKRKWGKWVCEIRLPNSRDRIWLGSYDSPDKAARAFDAALFCLRGSRANFNFPDTPLHFLHHHYHLQSLTHDQIREIAVTFAHQAPPSSSSLPPQQQEEQPPLHTESETTDEVAIDWSYLNEAINGSDYSGFYSELDDLHVHHFQSPSAVNQDNKREIIALADSGPSLFTLGTMFSADMSFTNSLSSVKLQCSLYGTSYLAGPELSIKHSSYWTRPEKKLRIKKSHE
ncbi:ethylene-responsive transcription factor ERF017-like [Senna tora]|uniref:Ethylene-responsive transcription factor ERF017-like n=1 Tax=Senna tora TaxID=362788 RepID=A0A834TAJ3_9FABA|nr:ethylene-responsive transcription factor ERF017-like [Senna tora]